MPSIKALLVYVEIIISTDLTNIYVLESISSRI